MSGFDLTANVQTRLWVNGVYTQLAPSSPHDPNAMSVANDILFCLRELPARNSAHFLADVDPAGGLDVGMAPNATRAGGAASPGVTPLGAAARDPHGYAAGTDPDTADIPPPPGGAPTDQGGTRPPSVAPPGNPLGGNDASAATARSPLGAITPEEVARLALEHQQYLQRQLQQQPQPQPQQQQQQQQPQPQPQQQQPTASKRLSPPAPDPTRDMYRVLREDGVLVINEYSEEAPSKRLESSLRLVRLLRRFFPEVHVLRTNTNHNTMILAPVTKSSLSSTPDLAALAKRASACCAHLGMGGVDLGALVRAMPPNRYQVYH